jgi:hypothetical protein
LQVLEAFLAPGSELWMFNEVPENKRERKLAAGELDVFGLENIKLVHREGNAVIRRHLESLPLETFDSVSFNFSSLRIYSLKCISVCALRKESTSIYAPYVYLI